MNEETQKFYSLEVHSTPEDITVTDIKGNTRHVLKQNAAQGNPLYNLTAREYLLDGSISASSFAAVHYIDGPLLFK